MSKADFQDRLQRIGANSTRQQLVEHIGVESVRQNPDTRKTNHGLMVAGAALMAIGVYAVKFAIQNHEALRNSEATGTLAGAALGGLAALVIGCMAMMRAQPKKGERDTTLQGAATPKRRASKGARIFFSLLGLAFGSLAIFYLFLTAAAHNYGTETAQTFAVGGLVIAMFLALISLVFGFVGLFLRGYALGRVPVYFVLGGMLTYSIVRIARINMLEWDQFVIMIQ